MRNEIDHNTILNGNIALAQPLSGYRIAIDSIIFGASLYHDKFHHNDKQRFIVELGCGVGGVILTHHFHHPNDRLLGIEIDDLNMACAYANIKQNHAEQTCQLTQADIHDLPLKKAICDAVVMNPPWYGRDWSPPQDERRAKALAIEGDMQQWIKTAYDILKPQGFLHMLIRSDDFLAVVHDLKPFFGGLHIYPIYSFNDKPAHRIIIMARKQSKANPIFYNGLIIHDRTTAQGRAPYTPQAQNILDGNEYLNWR